MKIPRIMIAAAASGSGKTSISCALMQALKNREYRVVSAKCGPDYIDPMFHREVLGIEAENLDLFFCEQETLNQLFADHAGDAQIAVLEGVMGYYDGMKLASDKASSYDVAKALRTPVILVVPCKGASLSVLAVIKGLIEFRKDSNIRGIILNRVSAGLYPAMKEMIETGLREMGHLLPVVGYVPQSELFHLESRHLGLVMPGEYPDLKGRIEAAAELLAETVDLNQIMEIAESAPDLDGAGSDDKTVSVYCERPEHNGDPAPAIRLGIARDQAFCFYYKSNLEILRRLGCELVEFSPLQDEKLPPDLSGILLGGGYPELHAGTLAGNVSFRNSLRRALEADLPCFAECGGFMYLQEWLEDADGCRHEMVGILGGGSRRRERLVRFGYINITGTADEGYLRAGEQLRGHEFHYWDSDDNGNSCMAEKPDGSRSWACIHMKGNLFAGYPHLHYLSNPEAAKRFTERMREYAGRNEGNK